MSEERPRVLVLGASGRLGRLLRRVWTETAPVDALWQVRRPDGLAGSRVFAPLEEPAAFVRAAEGTAAILDLAGVTDALREADFALNVRLACASLAAARAAGAGRVFLLSSAAVYGRTVGPIAEGHPLLPLTAYGRSKRAMEAAVRAGIHADRPGTGAVILRLGNVAGADRILGPGPFGAAAPKRRIVWFPGGHGPRRSYIGPRRLADVLARLVRARSLPEVLNLALPGAVDGSALLAAAGVDVERVEAEACAIVEVCLDTRRLWRCLGETPPAADAAGIVADLRSVVQAVAA